MIENIWVVEYSKSQGCYHITTLEESVKVNKKMFDENNGNDYQIIATANDMDEAYKLADEIKRNASNSK